MFYTVDTMIAYIEGLKRQEKKMTLQYMFDLCRLYGNPQNKLKFIHIGGTNGKGSTVTFVKSMLLASNYHVGTFISPYVVCFNERITYDDTYITDQDILHYGNAIIARFDEVTTHLDRLPSFFEFLTLLAFLYFADKHALDYVVLEVGIGGTLDCTNIVTPLVSGVTNVSYDHMAILGNTLDEIWDNKLGIVKAGIPFVTHENDLFGQKIKQTCQTYNAPLTLVRQMDISNIDITLDHTVFDYKGVGRVSLQMLGVHQVDNASLAIEIVLCLPKPNNVRHETMQKGLHDAFWPGRLELLSLSPRVYIDGAHNVGGIEKLHQFIQSIKQNYAIRLIFAVSANKEKDKMIAELEPVVDEIIFTHFSYKRSDEAINLYSLSSHPCKRMIENLDDIIILAKQDYQGITIFCGSLFFVSEVRRLFKR